MARISFAFIYPDRRGKNVMRQVGFAVLCVASSAKLQGCLGMGVCSR